METFRRYLVATQGFSGNVLDSAANSERPLCSQVSSFPLLLSESFSEILTLSADVLAATARLMPQQRDTSQALKKKKLLGSRICFSPSFNPVQQSFARPKEPQPNNYALRKKKNPSLQKKFLAGALLRYQKLLRFSRELLTVPMLNACLRVCTIKKVKSSKS